MKEEGWWLYTNEKREEERRSLTCRRASVGVSEILCWADESQNNRAQSSVISHQSPVVERARERVTRGALQQLTTLLELHFAMVAE